jgi:hypothetical protein
MMRSHEDRISVTNHFYLMTSHPGPVGPIHDAGYSHISHEIASVLAGLSLHHSTMDEIWCCVQQVEGYKANCWTAILMKLDIPEDRCKQLINVISSASRDRQFCEFLFRIYFNAHSHSFILVHF